MGLVSRHWQSQCRAGAGPSCSVCFPNGNYHYDVLLKLLLLLCFMDAPSFVSSKHTCVSVAGLVADLGAVVPCSTLGEVQDVAVHALHELLGTPGRGVSDNPYEPRPTNKTSIVAAKAPYSSVYQSDTSYNLVDLGSAC